MVASNPMDVSPKGRPLLDEQSSASASASPPAVVSPGRPLLPAERNVNAFMNDFNAGVVDFLKGEEQSDGIGFGGIKLLRLRNASGRLVEHALRRE